MKTPMQELIDKVKQLKYSEINEQAWDAYDNIMNIAESMLQKEKDLIQNVFQEGQEFPPLIHGKDNYSWLNYYNETYGGNK
jgi:hypothetical protein